MRIYRDGELIESLGSGIPRILRAYGEDCFKFTNNFIRITLPISVQDGTKLALSWHQVGTQLAPSVENVDKWFCPNLGAEPTKSPNLHTLLSPDLNSHIHNEKRVAGALPSSLFSCNRNNSIGAAIFGAHSLYTKRHQYLTHMACIASSECSRKLFLQATEDFSRRKKLRLFSLSGQLETSEE